MYNSITELSLQPGMYTETTASSGQINQLVHTHQVFDNPQEFIKNGDMDKKIVKNINNTLTITFTQEGYFIKIQAIRIIRTRTNEPVLEKLQLWNTTMIHDMAVSGARSSIRHVAERGFRKSLTRAMFSTFNNGLHGPV